MLVSVHVEILLGRYYELDQDIQVSRDKVEKTNLLVESRVTNYPTNILKIKLVIREDDRQARSPDHHVVNLGAGL